MQYGIDTQDEALAAYEQKIGTLIYRCVTLFVPHPQISAAGCSPDDDGLVEVKCPNSAQHIDMLLGKPIDQRYLYQMQFQMACTGRRWCDFVS
jgi:YqaJ-like viral recombinase domain